MPWNPRCNTFFLFFLPPFHVNRPNRLLSSLLAAENVSPACPAPSWGLLVKAQHVSISAVPHLEAPPAP